MLSSRRTDSGRVLHPHAFNKRPVPDHHEGAGTCVVAPSVDRQPVLARLHKQLPRVCDRPPSWCCLLTQVPGFGSELWQLARRSHLRIVCVSRSPSWKGGTHNLDFHNRGEREYSSSFCLGVSLVLPGLCCPPLTKGTGVQRQRRGRNGRYRRKVLNTQLHSNR